MLLTSDMLQNQFLLSFRELLATEVLDQHVNVYCTSIDRDLKSIDGGDNLYWFGVISGSKGEATICIPGDSIYKIINFIFGGDSSTDAKIIGKDGTRLEFYIFNEITECVLKALAMAGCERKELTNVTRFGIWKPDWIFSGDTFSKINYSIELLNNVKAEVSILVPGETFSSLFQSFNEFSSSQSKESVLPTKKDMRDEVIAMLSESDPEPLDLLFHNEHPTVQAAILVMLPRDTAAKLLTLFPKTLWRIIMVRVAVISEIRHLGIQAIYSVLNNSRELLRNRKFYADKNEWADIFNRLSLDVQFQLRKEMDEAELSDPDDSNDSIKKSEAS